MPPPDDRRLEDRMNEITALRDEMRQGFATINDQLSGVRSDLGEMRKEIGGELAGVHVELGAQNKALVSLERETGLLRQAVAVRGRALWKMIQQRKGR